MSLYGAFDRTRLLEELTEPYEGSSGVVTAAVQKAKALKNLGLQSSATTPPVAGTVVAGGVVVVDSSLNLAALNNLSMTGDLTVDGAVGTGADSAAVVKLTTPETTVVVTDQLGRIDFSAPLEASGTDAILVAASIAAVAEDTFAADNNKTALVFMTGASEAAAEKMRIDNAGKMTHLGTLATGADATDRVAIKGIYMSPANVVTAVPTIADGASDSVAVDVSGAFSMAPAVGDAVIAIPQEALPTDCLLLGAYVSGTDTITVSFGTKEGGGGVTGANKNFKFLVIDVT